MSTGLARQPGRQLVSGAVSPHGLHRDLDATLTSNVGSWMYSAASGWLMTSLNPDPLIVALSRREFTADLLVGDSGGRVRRYFSISGNICWWSSCSTPRLLRLCDHGRVRLATPGNLLLFTLLIAAPER